MKIRIVFALLSFLVLAFCDAGAQTISLAGDWSGESICFGNNSSCHDEKVVYHISIDPADPSKIKIRADKVVDGKPEWMGDIVLKYNASKQALTGDLQSPRYRGVWEFTIKGDIIEGGLYILPDRTMGRKIRVQRNQPTGKDQR